MKKILLVIFVFSFAWTQCDANGDGELDILDIIEEVNCILDGCWESPEPSGDIYGFWMMDSVHFQVSMNDTVVQNDTQYCGEYDEYYYEESPALILYFNDDGEGGEYNIDASFCGLNEVDLSNPSFAATWSYSYYDDTLIINFTDEYGYEHQGEFTVQTLDENRFVFYMYMVDDYYGYTYEITYDFHRVTPINLSGTVLNSNNKKVSLLDYKKYINTIQGISD